MLYRLHFSLFLIVTSFSVSAANPVEKPEKECPRIISQSPYISEMLNYLGMEQCIVGVSRYSKRDLPHTGGILDPDADAIDSLMPDIILTSDWTKEDTLKKVTPKGVKTLRLKSFNQMAQLEKNMTQIINVTGWYQAKPKVKSFANKWRAKVKQVKGNNKKVLLLSSCSGKAYSFGPNSRLYDLFTQAGFKVVETKEKIRHIREGKEIEDMTALLNRYKPNLLFIFEQKLKKSCQMIMPKVPVSILSFDGKKFLNPNVAILDGLDLLINQKHRWNQI